MKKTYLLILALSLVLSIFFRFYNLKETARFIHDDAYNLFDMHKIFQNRDLTLIGPRISEGPGIIYPSLTHYMLLPATVVGDFNTFAPSYGSAFYGVITVLVILLLCWKLNKTFLPIVAILAVFWFPLIETARIPWNPHLVPLLQTIAILLYFYKKKVTYFFSGIFFGLTFHLHYYNFVSFLMFLVLIFTQEWFEQKKSKKRLLETFSAPILISLGFFIMILPFIYFDLKNPPGLFFGRFLRQNLVLEGMASNSSLAVRIWESFAATFISLGGSLYGAIVLGVLIITMLVSDFKKRLAAMVLFTPFATQVAAIALLPNFEPRYFYLALGFFIAWLIQKRDAWQTYLTIVIIAILVFTSIPKVYFYLTKPLSTPSAYEVNLITKYMLNKIRGDDMKNVNVAALASPDKIPLGLVYRVLLSKDGVILRPENQYTLSDNLFVISTSAEAVVRNDLANVMDGFRGGRVSDTYFVPNTSWRVYLFHRDDR